MTIFDSVILGIVEGLTEFLPVSSTGHLILASSALGIPQTDFAKTFDIAIQLGAILAVVVLYWRSFFDFGLLTKLVVAFIPTGLIGLALYHLVKTYLLGNDYVVIASLFLGGLVLIAFEKRYGKQKGVAREAPVTSLTYRQAVAVGLAQAVAIVPGVSRSGATIVGGMLLGISRPTIVAFSFLLAVPTMLAATGLSLYKAHAFAFATQEWVALGTGFVVSFAVALPAIRWLLSYVRTHSFVAFGVYRIVLSCLFLIYLLW
jgi:undecaprenyl-diphosphatase